MGQWFEVARSGQIAPGEGRTVTAGGRRVALFNDGGEYLAIDDTCPHQGGSLGEGVFFEGRVVCPLHSWVFEVRTGQCPRGSHEPVSTYPTRCLVDRIEVHMASEESDGEASG